MLILVIHQVFNVLARLTKGDNSYHDGFRNDSDANPTKWKHARPQDYHVTPAGYSISFDGVLEEFQVAVLEYGSHGASDSQAIGLFVELSTGDLKPVAVSIDLGCDTRGGDFTPHSELYAAQGGTARHYQKNHVWISPATAPSWSRKLFFDGSGLLPRFHHAIGEFSARLASDFKYATIAAERDVVNKEVPTKAAVVAKEEASVRAARRSSKASSESWGNDEAVESEASKQSVALWARRPAMAEKIKQQKLRQAHARDYTSTDPKRLTFMLISSNLSTDGTHEEKAARMKSNEIHAAEIFPRLLY